MRHSASPEFWRLFDSLPPEIQELARGKFEILRHDPRHPSLHFKEIGGFRSVRVGLRYRALGREIEDGVLWFWIGTHAEYDRMVR